MILRRGQSQREVVDASLLVGRSSRCALVLDESWVSGQHARLYWDGEAWWIKDLASRNGTFVNGEQLSAGSPRRLSRGDRVAFGQREAEWRVGDVDPPTLLAVPEDGGAPLPMAEGLLALPHADAPEVTLFLDPREGFVLERGGERRGVRDGLVVQAGGRAFSLRVPQWVSPTATADHQRAGPRLVEVALRFRVSRDEEHVQLVAALRGETHDLRSRAHHYLLLTLARERIADLERGLPPEGCGWIHVEEIARRLRAEPEHVNLHVFRARKQIACVGVEDPAELVERRLDAHQIRIGTGLLDIELV
ncbi:MAG: FHA domain-containing protein [Myxococcota bacterium]|nr:FHA domain-containing protein [Myxococcota bacterium]